MQLPLTLHDVQFWLIRFCLLLVVICVERMGRVPLISLFVALSIAWQLPPRIQILWLGVAAILIATVFMVPFYLIVGLFFSAQVVLEVVPWGYVKHEIVAGLVCLGAVLFLELATGQSLALNQVGVHVILLSVLVWVILKVQAQTKHSLSNSSWLQWYEKHQS